MKKGKKNWVFCDGYLPPNGDNPEFEGHEALMLTNLNDKKANIELTFIFEDKQLEPDERAVGSAVMHFDKSCDVVIAVGSGVVNDIGKILANATNLPYIIVGTAPSMDGYASAGSPLLFDASKATIKCTTPRYIIGDLDVLKDAGQYSYLELAHRVERDGDKHMANVWV